jgi:ATP-binding cassette subfamily F protein uup
MGYMKDFLFTPEQARTPVGVLSGGERARLLLARTLAQPSTLLVLDEPTNDLDLETLDLLQEMIGDYGGTVILVSHDRDFLDRTVDTMIVSEGNGKWQVYAGGYSDMVAQRGRGVGAREAVFQKERTPRADTSATLEVSRKRKLSYKEQHALRTLPDRIAQLESDITKLKAELAAPDLFTRDAARFKKAATELEAAEKSLAEAEDAWLAAEIARESLES